MPRPKTKDELITAANEQFDKLQTLINSMSEEEQNGVLSYGDAKNLKEAHWERDKNLRDVLVHLYEWHQMLINWLVDNKAGKARPFLLESYNWKTYGDMNVFLWKKHQTTSLEDAKAQLSESHKRVLELVEPLSEEELFEKQAYTWTGSSNIASYCISTTSSHYDWAIKKLKLYLKYCHA